MKSLHIFWTVLLFALLVSCAVEKKNELEGAWEFVSGRTTTPDTTFEYTHDDWNEIKVLTKSHWVFVGQEPNRPKFTEGGTDAELLAAAETFNAGGGKYTLEGDTYTEHIEYFLNPNAVNVSIPFKYQLEDDQWTISGTWPETNTELYEVWRRIE